MLFVDNQFLFAHENSARSGFIWPLTLKVDRRCYMAEILPIRRKTLYNQSI